MKFIFYISIFLSSIGFASPVEKIVQYSCDNPRPLKINLKCGDHWLKTFIEIDFTSSQLSAYFDGDSQPDVESLKGKFKYVLSNNKTTEIELKVKNNLITLTFDKETSTWFASFQENSLGFCK